MFLIRFAIGTFSFALLGLAFALAPAPTHQPTAGVVAVMHH